MRRRGFVRMPRPAQPDGGRPHLQPVDSGARPDHADRVEGLGSELLEFAALQRLEGGRLAVGMPAGDGFALRIRFPTEFAGRAMELAARLFDLRRDERRELDGWECAEVVGW